MEKVRMALQIGFELVAVMENGPVGGFAKVLSGPDEKVRFFDLDLKGNEPFIRHKPPVGPLPVFLLRPFGLRSHEVPYPSETRPMRRNFS